jgi:serine/threonine protein kinase
MQDTNADGLLNALSLLNKAHLIHCDLKPENILLKKSVSPVTLSRLDVGVDSLAFIASRTEVNDLDDWALEAGNS